MNSMWTSAVLLLCVVLWAARSDAQDNATSTPAPDSAMSSPPQDATSAPASSGNVYYDTLFGSSGDSSIQSADPQTKCQQMVQQYGSYQITNSTYVQDTCTLTCFGNYTESAPQNLYTGTVNNIVSAYYSYEITTGVDDLRPCGDGQMCVQSSCVKLANDFHDVCQQNVDDKPTLAVQTLGGCKVKCISAGNVTSQYGSMVPGLLLEDVILPDNSPCNDGKGQCSGGNCLSAELFPAKAC